VVEQKPKRANLPAISDEMRAWCAALAEEVADWPRAEARCFFGFTALYRGDKMFAALPRTRALEGPNALAFKLGPPTAKLRASLEKDSRICSFGKDKGRWFMFEISSGADLHDALEWLSRAYSAAGHRRKSK
jgi:hypothetical protein